MFLEKATERAWRNRDTLGNTFRSAQAIFRADKSKPQDFVGNFADIYSILIRFVGSITEENSYELISVLNKIDECVKDPDLGESIMYIGIAKNGVDTGSMVEKEFLQDAENARWMYKKVLMVRIENNYCSNDGCYKCDVCLSDITSHIKTEDIKADKKEKAIEDAKKKKHDEALSCAISRLLSMPTT
jgi:hypothetical protein